MDIKIKPTHLTNDTTYIFSYVDPATHKRVQRQCKDCYNEKDAMQFARNYLQQSASPYLIRNICKDMYVKGKSHLLRLAAFGKEPDAKTISQKRYILDLICSQFGNEDIRTFNFIKVSQYLLPDTHSGSWKNLYIDTFGSIYDETAWVCKNPVPRPKFMRFARNPISSAPLSKEELTELFMPQNWANANVRLLFLITLSCGLRIGEARGLQARQFLFDKKVLVVDGFCKSTGERTCFNKKGSVQNPKIRVVPLTDKLVNLVKFFITANNLQPADFLFTNQFCEPYKTQYLGKSFKAALQKSNIAINGRKITPHSLRYTYVTQMREVLDVDTVRKLVGHTTIEMTDYYTRCGFDELLHSAQNSQCAVNQIF